MTIETKEYYPANLYKVCKKYSDSDNSVERVHLFLNIYTQVLNYFGCIFLSEYMYSDESNNKINKQIKALMRPSYGQWLDFIRTYCKHMDGNIFLKEFKDCYDKISDDKKVDYEYKGRFRNPKSKRDNAFNELLALRNSIAHGGITPGEKEAVDIIKGYEPYLEKILSGFDPIFNKYLVVKLIDFVENADGYSCEFDIIRYQDYHVDNYEVEISDEMIIPDDELEEDGMYLLDKEEKRLLQFAEYMVYLIEEKDDAQHEDYYLYAGFGNKNVTYMGCMYVKKLDEYYDAIKVKFTEHGASMSWGQKTFTYEAFSQYTNDLARISIDINKSNNKYIPERYVERECDALLEEFLFSDKTIMVVTAEAGVGKTNYLCHSAERIIEGGDSVYFYNGASLNEFSDESGEEILFSKLQKECLNESEIGTSHAFLKLIDKKMKKENVSENAHFVLVIDAANESYHTLKVLSEVDELSKYGEQYPWLKIIISIRTVNLHILQNRVVEGMGKPFNLFRTKERYYTVIKSEKEEMEVKIEEWNTIQVMDAFDRYSAMLDDGINHPTYMQLDMDVQKAIQNPLNMRLYFKTLSDGNTSEIHKEKDLFVALDNYLVDKSDVGICMMKLLEKLVDNMIGSLSNVVDYDLASDINEKIYKEISAKNYSLEFLTPLERLEDEGLIYIKEEEGKKQVAFVYQKYLEYRLALYLKSAYTDMDTLIDEMIKARNYERFQEMYIACVNCIKEQPSVAKEVSHLITHLQEVDIPVSEMRDIIVELWYDAVLRGETDKVIDDIQFFGLMSYGVLLAERLYHNEESKATYSLMKPLIDYYKDHDEAQYGILTLLLGKYYMRISDFDKADELFTISMNIKGGSWEQEAAVRLAQNCRKAGNVTRAKEIADSLIAELDENNPHYAAALVQKGLCYYSDGDKKLAYEIYEQAHKLSEAINDHYTTLYNELGMSTVLSDQRKMKECEELLHHIYKDTRKYGYFELTCDSLNGLAKCMVRTQRYHEALNYATEGLTIWKHSGYYSGQMVMYCWILESLIGINSDSDEIIKYMNEAKAILPYFKEKVIINTYNDTMTHVNEYLRKMEERHL